MNNADLKGRTFFVTGANAGIGRATVEALAARGASLVLASRSEEKTRPVVDALRLAHAGSDIDFVQIDLASLASVKRAAEAFLGSGRALDVLINNAGLAGKRDVSADGYEITYATNHLGPYFLTELLLPRLRESPQGRIVNVSSRLHLKAKRIDWDSLRRPVAARHVMVQYGMSKLMNVLHAKELARRLAGTRVTTSSLHPGRVASDVWREIPWPIRWLMTRTMITNEQGARTSLYCATSPDLTTVSGRYYEDCQEARSNPLADDPSLASELFERSDAAIQGFVARG